MLSPGRRSLLRKREIAVEYLYTVECLYAVERLLKEIAVEHLYTVECLIRRRAFIKGENRRRASLYRRVPLRYLAYRRRASREKVVSHRYMVLPLVLEKDAMIVRTAKGDRAIT